MPIRHHLPSITFRIFVEAATIFFDGPVFLLIGSRGFPKRGLTPLRNKLFCHLFRALSLAMDFSKNEVLAPIAIEKIKILGAVFELPAKQL